MFVGFDFRGQRRGVLLGLVEQRGCDRIIFLLLFVFSSYLIYMENEEIKKGEQEIDSVQSL